MINPSQINPEHLAYWFFRLNGCLTIVNFVVHPDHGRASQRTDADVLAVRFPHRAELHLSGQAMQDHALFDCSGQIDIFLAEVKHGLCDFNGTWSNQQQENMHRVLYAVGAFPEAQVSIVASSLYDRGSYENSTYRVRLVAVGGRWNHKIADKTTQLTWDEILDFTWERFRLYEQEKHHHSQWDEFGQRLYNEAITLEKAPFIQGIKQAMRNYVDSAR